MLTYYDRYAIRLGAMHFLSKRRWFLFATIYRRCTSALPQVNLTAKLQQNVVSRFLALMDVVNRLGPLILRTLSGRPH